MMKYISKRPFITSIFASLLLTSLAWLHAADEPKSLTQPAAPTIAPTESDVHYGDHERQVLDFYKAKSAGRRLCCSTFMVAVG